MSQLHEDLIAIRESQNLTAEDIFDRTRISVENTESIESGELFGSDRNKTYIRSFARTYAKALGIKDEDMVHALDLVDIGSYSGFLKETYLGKDAKSETEKPKKTDDKPDKKTGSATLFDDSGVSKKKTDEKKDDEPDTKSPGAPEIESISPDENEPKLTDESKETAKPIRPKSSMSIASERRKIDWSETNKKVAKTDESRKPLIALIIILLLLAVIGGVIYYLVQDRNGSETIVIPEQEETHAPATDQLQPQADRPALPSDTLDAPVPPSGVTTAIPDTITVQIYAAYGNLEPFRVRSDTFENRRPYWVATGRAMRVKFVDEIHIYNHRDRMLILHNGRVVNQFAEESSEEQRVTIRRSQFENDPTFESFTTELPQNVRPPVEVIDRPVIMN